MLHPRDSKGRFTRSFTRVLKPQDNRLARKIIAAFAPKAVAKGAGRSTFFAAFGGGDSGGNQQTRQAFQSGQLKAAHRAVRTEKAAVDSPVVRAIDAEMRPLPHDLEVHRRVEQARFGQVPPQELEGYKVKDAGWLFASLDPDDAPTGIHMRIRVPAGTRGVVVDEERGLLALDRELELAIVGVEPNGRGGWNMDMVALHRTKRGEGGDNSDQDQPDADGAEPAGNTDDGGPDALGDGQDAQPELPLEPAAPTRERQDAEPAPAQTQQPTPAPAAEPAIPRPQTADEQRRFVDEPELVAFRQPLQPGDTREYRMPGDSWVRIRRGDGDDFEVSERGVWGEAYPDSVARFGSEDDARREVAWRMAESFGDEPPQGERPRPLPDEPSEPTADERIAEMRDLDPEMLPGYVQALKGARLTAVARALGVNRGRVADKRTAIVDAIGGERDGGSSIADEDGGLVADARATTTPAGHRENLAGTRSRAEAEEYVAALDEEQLDRLLADTGVAPGGGPLDEKRRTVVEATVGRRFPAEPGDEGASQASQPPASDAASSGLTRLIPDNDEDAAARGADIKAAAQEIYGGTFGNGFSTRVSKVTARRGETIVEGFVFADVDGKAKRVGKFVRGFQRQDDGRVFVTHEEIEVDRTYQGSGFAVAFNAQAEEWYRANGVDRIRLRANKDVGAYAWARAGYDFDSADSARKVLDRVGRVMRLIDADSRIPEERKAEQADLARRFLERADGRQFGDEGFPTPYEVSQLGRWDGAGRDDFWLGKAALWGAAWDGVRPLTAEGTSARVRRLDELGQWHNEWSGDVIPRAEANFDPTGHPDDTDLNVHAQDWFADGDDEDRYAEQADTIVGGSWLDDDGADEPVVAPSAAADTPTSGADAVAAAYRTAQERDGGRFGDWASLTRIRREMSAAGMSRAEQDEALLAAARRDGISLAPENVQRSLTDADRAAAIHFGGQDKHLLVVDATFVADAARDSPAGPGIGAAGDLPPIATGNADVDAVALRQASRLPQIVQQALDRDQAVRIEELAGDHAGDVAIYHRNQLVLNSRALTPEAEALFEQRRADGHLGDTNGVPMLDHVIGHELGHGIAYQMTPTELGDLFDMIADRLNVDRPGRRDDGAAFLAAWIENARRAGAEAQLRRVGGDYGLNDWAEWIAEAWSGWTNGSTDPLTQAVGRWIEGLLDRPGRTVQPWPGT